MRIPIYTVDLADKHGFKRIAKKLQRSWPSAVPLKLSSAQEILSRGLGYRDFYDLRQSSDECIRQPPGLTQSEVRDAISTSIFVFCRSRKIIDIDDNELSRLVMSLPLQELSVYQSTGQSQTLAVTSEDFLKPSEGNRQTSSPVAQRPKAEQVEQSDRVDSNRKVTRQPVELISSDGLKSVWELVLRRGSLRDQSLFAVLLQGVRPYEASAAKCGHLLRSDSEALLRLRTGKARAREFKRFLPSSWGVLIARYINSAGLSEGDYLFPSSKDAALPMGFYEMNKIVVSYLREALGDVPQLSAHKIRLSVGAMAFGASKISLSKMTGHLSPLSLLPYLIGQKKPEE